MTQEPIPAGFVTFRDICGLVGEKWAQQNVGQLLCKKWKILRKIEHPFGDRLIRVNAYFVGDILKGKSRLAEKIRSLDGAFWGYDRMEDYGQ